MALTSALRKLKSRLRSEIALGHEDVRLVLIFGGLGIVVLPFMMAGGPVAYRMGDAVTRFTIFALAAVGPTWARIGLISGVLLGGRILFNTKKYAPKLYAAIELVVAAVMGGSALGTPHLRTEQDVALAVAPDHVLRLITSVYLAVRAMDNWSKKPTADDSNLPPPVRG